MDRSSAAHPDKRTANPQSDILLDSDYCRCLRTVVHYAGSRRPNLRSNGADLRLRADRLSDRNFYGYARFGLLPASRTCPGGRNVSCAVYPEDLFTRSAVVAYLSKNFGGDWCRFSDSGGLCGDATWQRVSTSPGRGQSLDPRFDAANNWIRSRRTGSAQNA